MGTGVCFSCRVQNESHSMYSQEEKNTIACTQEEALATVKFRAIYYGSLCLPLRSKQNGLVLSPSAWYSFRTAGPCANLAVLKRSVVWNNKIIFFHTRKASLARPSLQNSYLDLLTHLPFSIWFFFYPLDSDRHDILLIPPFFDYSHVDPALNFKL